MSAWFDYLTARMRLIKEWDAEGMSPDEILATMNMDPTQVRLLIQTARDHSRGLHPLHTIAGQACPVCKPAPMVP